MFSSCTKEKDYFYGNNQTPQFHLITAEQEVDHITDIIKTSVSDKYIVEYTVIDDQDSYTISWADVFGKGSVDLMEDHKIHIIPQTEKYKVRLYCIDPYGLKDDVLIDIETFSNLQPVAKFSYSILQNSFINIDAAESYDRDSAMGGRIIDYEYTVNGVSFLSKEDHFLHDLIEGVSFYNISLSVMDNDSVWSYPYSEFYFKD